MHEKGVKVKYDLKLKILGTNEAGFDYENIVIYIKKKPALVDLYHEGYHAEQFLKVGKMNYISLGRLAREEYVYQQILKNRYMFNDAELNTARKYIEKLRRML
jgi:hypothetical protein